MTFNFPPTMEGASSHKPQVTVNDSHVKSQLQTIGSIGRSDCGLEIIYFNARSILPKLDELRLLCADSSPHVVCIVETWLDDSVFDNELTIPNYCLVRLDRNRHGGGVLLYIRDDLSYNVIFMGPENLELLGITLYNGNNNRLCLCTLYSPPATTHLVFATAIYFFTES